MENKTKKTTEQTQVVKKNIQKKPAKTNETEKKKDFWGGLGNFVRKAVDCCLE